MAAPAQWWRLSFCAEREKKRPTTRTTTRTTARKKVAVCTGGHSLGERRKLVDLPTEPPRVAADGRDDGAASEAIRRDTRRLCGMSVSTLSKRSIA